MPITLEDWQKEDTETLFKELMNVGSFGVDRAFGSDNLVAAAFVIFGDDFEVEFDTNTTLHDILARLVFEVHQ